VKSAFAASKRPCLRSAIKQPPDRFAYLFWGFAF
jgi:hypothetical protein